MLAKTSLFLGVLLVTVAHAAPQTGHEEPYLVLDAGGHTATVNKVGFTPDGRHLVTIANDKTIRIWDVHTGESLDVLRPPIGDGPAGMLYALAISPDGRRLAVGGFEFGGQDHGIYVIRLPDRRIEAVLRGHTNVILDLAFSHDGRFLASASADTSARLWDLTTLRSAAILRGHRDSIYAVAFSPDDRFVATASLDKTGRIWSVRSRSETATLGGHAGAVQAIAWSPDGNTVATGCVNQSISLWSPAGRLTRRLEKLGNHVTSLCFTADSRELFFTLGGPAATDGGFIVDLATNRGRVAFAQHENSVMHGGLSPDGTLAATADANGEAFIWRTRDGLLVQRLRCSGHTAWSVAWDRQSDAIAWGNASDYVEPNRRGPLKYAFQLRELEFVVPVATNLKRAQASLQTLQATLVDPVTVSVARVGRRETLLKLASEYDQVRCFTALDENTEAIGSDFGLFLFDIRDGRQRQQLRGHTGTVWALAPSADGRYLLSCSEDQTLRVWSWRDGRLLVSLFFADHEWIAWTPEGYYAASAGGERLMGWHVNNGPNRLASFYPAVRFRKSLYRPDVICRLLDTGDVQGALAETDGLRQRESQPTTVEQVLPPMVRITSPVGSPIEVIGPTVTVQASAQSRSPHPVIALRLLLDGRPYEGRKGVQVVDLDAMETTDEVQEQWIVQLAAGRHTLAVQAETTVSKGLSDAVEVVYREVDIAEQPRLPDLNILAVGVSEYPAHLRLEYAAKDAQLLVRTLQEVSTPLFGNVQIRLLTNDQATRREMLSGLTWLRREMTQRDVCMVFFSGHGAKDSAGNFYLVPVDGDPQDLLATGVSGSQFKDALAAIPGRVLVLLDACHAGAAGGDRRKAIRGLTDDLIRDLVTDDYGVVVMCSSMGREYSMESEIHQQGFFTLALVEALTGKADFNKDGMVYLTEVDAYLCDRVKTLTQGQQHPVTTKPATIRSFPLGKPAESNRGADIGPS